MPRAIVAVSIEGWDDFGGDAGRDNDVGTDKGRLTWLRSGLALMED